MHQITRRPRGDDRDAVLPLPEITLRAPGRSPADVIVRRTADENAVTEVAKGLDTEASVPM